MKFNPKVALSIFIMCIFFTLISIYFEHEKKDLFSNSHEADNIKRLHYSSLSMNQLKQDSDLNILILPIFINELTC